MYARLSRRWCIERGEFRGLLRQLHPGRIESAGRPAWSLVVVVSIILLLIGYLELLRRFHEPPELALALSALRVVPLALGRTRPLACWWWCLATTIFTSGALVLAAPHKSWPWPGSSMLIMLAVLGIAGHLVAPGASLAMWVLTNGWALVLIAVFPHSFLSWNQIESVGVLSAVVLLAAQVQRQRGWAHQRIVETERRSEVEHQRRARLEERARIARELHDVVAHHMSVIAVQAGSAPLRVDSVGRAHREFCSLAESARSSLNEMRWLLGVLRSEDVGSEVRLQASGPLHLGLAELPFLVTGAESAGVSVTLSVEPAIHDIHEWTPAGELAVYRVVQEGVSNVIRHAVGANASIRLYLDSSQLVVSVANGPSTPLMSPLARSMNPAMAGAVMLLGHPCDSESQRTPSGLRGVAERASMFGGTTHAGPTADGGFELEVRFAVERLIGGAAT